MNMESSLQAFVALCVIIATGAISQETEFVGKSAKDVEQLGKDDRIHGRTFSFEDLSDKIKDIIETVDENNPAMVNLQVCDLVNDAINSAVSDFLSGIGLDEEEINDVVDLLDDLVRCSSSSTSGSGDDHDPTNDSCNPTPTNITSTKSRPYTNNTKPLERQLTAKLMSPLLMFADRLRNRTQNQIGQVFRQLRLTLAGIQTGKMMFEERMTTINTFIKQKLEERVEVLANHLSSIVIRFISTLTTDDIKFLSLIENNQTREFVEYQIENILPVIVKILSEEATFDDLRCVLTENVLQSQCDSLFWDNTISKIVEDFMLSISGCSDTLPSNINIQGNNSKSIEELENILGETNVANFMLRTIFVKHVGDRNRNETLHIILSTILKPVLEALTVRLDQAKILSNRIASVLAPLTESALEQAVQSSLASIISRGAEQFGLTQSQARDLTERATGLLDTITAAAAAAAAAGRLSRETFNAFNLLNQFGSGNLVDTNTVQEAFTALAQIYSSGYDTSQRCQLERSAVSDGLQSLQSWALLFVDSLGKPGNGILQGNSYFVGNFDQCESIHHVTSMGDVIKGHFVKYRFYFNVSPGIPLTGGFASQDGGLPYIVWGVCLPQGCNTQDAETIGQGVADGLKFHLISTVILDGREPSSSPGFICAMLLLGMLGLFCVIGTLLDVTGALGQSDQKRSATLLRFFLAFSVTRNTQQIMDARHSPGDITCLHGIRVISISWVILGHTYVFLPQFANLVVLQEMSKWWTFNAIRNALFAVDTFFVLSGCLVAYLFLRAAKRAGGVKPMHMVLYYVHRYLRLTPLLMLAVLLYVSVCPYLEYGPFQTEVVGREEACRERWWWNALYIQNLFDESEFCMGWTWYLPNDMQFYAIAPLIIVPLALGYKFIGLLVAFIQVSLHFIMFTYLEEKYDATVTKNWDAYFTHIYIKPYTRCGPYAIGLVLGYILFMVKFKVKLRSPVVFVGWLAAIAGGLTLVFITHDNYKIGGVIDPMWPDDVSNAYEIVSRPLWALCVAWVIFACCTGYGGVINTFLSWRAWIPLSRLTYGVYLFHVMVMQYFHNNRRSVAYFTKEFVIELYLAVFILSYALAYIASLLIETPVRNLTKPSKPSGNITPQSTDPPNWDDWNRMKIFTMDNETPRFGSNLYSALETLLTPSAPNPTPLPTPSAKKNPKDTCSTSPTAPKRSIPDIHRDMADSSTLTEKTHSVAMKTAGNVNDNDEAIPYEDRGRANEYESIV